MIFSLHGGSAEEETALKRFGAGFVVYEASEQTTQGLDGGPPPERVGSAQDPLPGLDTPPCR